MKGAPVQEATPSKNYKWVALAITTISVFMFAVDGTVVVIAVPSIMTDFDASLVSAVWVLMGYTLVSTVFLLTLGRVADIYGRVRLFKIGFIIFTIGSAFCGLSLSDVQLVASRLVQGLGGGMIVINTMAIITEAFPSHERGMALGINSTIWGVGSIVGPVVGGLILGTASWRWIFLINIPIGAIGVILAFIYLREISTRQHTEKLDLAGASTFTFGLLCLLLALTQGIELGWTSPPILTLFGLSIIAFILFPFLERRVEYPALDLSLFQNRVFSYAVLSAMLQSLALFSVQFLIVFYLQAVRGYPPLTAALLLLPFPVTNALFGAIGGRLSDKIGQRWPSTVGLLLQALALYWLSTITANSPYEHIGIGLALMGTGGALFWASNTSAAMGSAPPARLGIAAASLATLRNTGMVTSYALALAVAAAALPRETMLNLFAGANLEIGTPLMEAFVGGIQAAFRVSIFICLIAAVLSFVHNPQETRH